MLSSTFSIMLETMSTEDRLSISVCSALVILLASTFFVSYCSHEIYITTSSDSKCDNESCYILDEFCMNTGVLPSDACLTFLAGEYKLETNCIFNGTSNLTLTGQSVTIECSSHEDIGLIFYEVSGLVISNITFISCGTDWNITTQLPEVTHSQIQAALLFIGGSDHTLTNIAVLNAKSAGIHIYNVAGKVNLDSCEVTNASSETLSGNIVAFDCSVASTTLTIKSSTFTENGYKDIQRNCSLYSYVSGLALLLGSPAVTVKIKNASFSYNTGCHGGNLEVVLYNHSSVMISNTVFLGGKANFGGGVFVLFRNSFLDKNMSITDSSNISPVLNIANSMFIENCAEFAGGGVYVQWRRSLILNSYSYQVQVANSTFRGNYLAVGSSGLAFRYKVYVDTSNDPYNLFFFLVTLNLTNCSFTHHQPNSSSTEFQSGSSVILVENAPYFGINGIIVESNNCTGIQAIRSTLVFYSSTTIQNNSALKGGGIRLCSDAMMYFTPNTTLVVTNNTAHQTGGGIQVYSNCMTSKQPCFFQYSKEFIQNPDVLSTLTFTVSNNSAQSGGDNIYGGSLSNCYHINVKKGERQFLDHLQVPKNTINQSSSVSSDPQHVCFNFYQDYLCNRTVNVSVYPGEKITLPIRVLGQKYGSVSGTVLASVSSGGAIEPSQEAQVSEILGESIYTYTVYSSQPDNFIDEVEITLKPGLQKGTNFYELYSKLYSEAVINVCFKKCPFGFVNKQITSTPLKHSCKCISLNSSIKCFIQNQTISKPASSWLGMYKLNNQTYLASSKYCPLDYCNSSITMIKSSATSLSQDVQCQYNRTGILCGSCPKGWSMVLGTSECRQKCSNIWLFMILPFALAGLFLVAVIHFLNLTVTMGTVCGLIFYANVIQDHAISLLSPHRIPGLTKILQIFLSWLNLDHGIATCFYNGMGAFGKTILVFVFPIYIWLISVVIIFLSNRYIFFTTLVGENAVKVLATLFLLSYSKVIRTSLNAFNLKYLSVHVNSSYSIYEARWNLDGNVAYFSFNHSALLVTASLFILFLLPFSLFLLCIRHVYSLSNCSRLFSWVDKLKPFFDTYTGPFKDKASFWTGLLLFVRLLLLILHVFDFREHVIPYYIVIVVCLSLLGIMIFFHGVYMEQSLNFLECFFILNITMVFLIHTYKGGPNLLQSILTHILVSSAFLVFLGILFYHAYIKFSHVGWLKRFRIWNHDSDVDLLSFNEMRK